MISKGLTFVFSFFLITLSFTQQLIINEVSQGQNSAEYVEFVVIGTQSCTLPVPSVDLRKVIIDDNNGYFAPGSGTGIAAGAIRFADIAFWSEIPQGTFIVIYNESDRNSLIPPDDLSLSDGNCRLIIPASSTLLEVTTVNSPSTITNLYPSNSNWIAGGNWSPLAMSNSNDSFQIPNLQINGTPLHAVSWGNNTTNPIIYFSGSANAKVFSFQNSFSNDWNNQQNWIAGDVGIDETPGAANSPENDAWIATMNPSCGVLIPLNLEVTFQNESCSGECNGSATVSVLNGTSNYSYNWSNGSTSQTVSNLCSGSYQVEVSDLNGCPNSSTQSVTISSQNQSIAVTIEPVSILNVNSSNLQLISSQMGGTWSSSDCSSCISSTGIFSPQTAGVGLFNVCYQLANVCPSSACVQIQVENPCVPQSTSESMIICPEDSVFIFDNWESNEEIFSQNYIDMNGCESNHIINLTHFVVTNIDEIKSICNGDSILIGNNWIKNSGDYTINEKSVNGCTFKHHYSIVYEKCIEEEFYLYIPNSFTPDGGKANDFFEPVITGGYLKEGIIFNRWGEIIKKLDQNNIQWNGNNQNGEKVPDGLYIYIIKAQSDNGEEVVRNGFITVIK